MDNDTSTTTYSSNNGTTGTTEADDCTLLNNYMDWMFSFFYFPVSVALTICLSFIVRRKRLLPNFCWGRPGVFQAVNFIDEVGRRWAYAACFIILTYDIINLLLGNSFWDIIYPTDPQWRKQFKWVSVIYKLFEVFTVCMVYYPLIACVDHRHYIVANIVGLLYVIPWIVMYSIVFSACPIQPRLDDFDTYLPILKIPVYIAFYVVGFSYILDLIRNIIRKIRQRSRRTTEREGKHKRTYKTDHHFQYVVNLFGRRPNNNNTEEKTTFKDKLKNLLRRGKYEKIMGFRYSARLICSLTVAILVLITGMLVVAYAIEALIGLPTQLSCAFYSAFGFKVLGWLCDKGNTIRALMHTSSALSALVIVILLLNTLISYKRRWHQLLRGDHSWHMYGTTLNSPQNIVLSGLKFAGYQVAFVMWGYVVLTVVLFIALMFIVFAFFLPLIRHDTDPFSFWFIQVLIDIWPSLLLGMIIIPLIQKFICYFFFIQGKGQGLALDNRRIYNSVSYYFFILNVLAGIFSCLLRIIIPLGLGIVFLSRLDQPLIMKGFESMDPGYKAFVSMLLVDLYHNHPVVKAFTELLLHVRERSVSDTGDSRTDLTELEQKVRRSKLVRNRWLKTITLANNPCLALKAIEQRLKDERRNGPEKLSTGVYMDITYEQSRL